MKITTILMLVPLLYIASCKKGFSEYPRSFYYLETELQISSAIRYFDSTSLVSDNFEEARYLFDSINWYTSSQVAYSRPIIEFLTRDTASLIYGFDRVGFSVDRLDDSITILNHQDTLQGEILYWDEDDAEILFSKGGYLIIFFGENGSKAEMKFGSLRLDDYLVELGSGKLYVTEVALTYANGSVFHI